MAIGNAVASLLAVATGNNDNAVNAMGSRVAYFSPQEIKRVSALDTIDRTR